MKRASTSSELFSLSVQGLPLPLPLHAPSQPANREPGRGVAVRVTAFSYGKRWVHVFPQPIPVGELVTLPAPLPTSLTTSVCAAARVYVNDPALLGPKPLKSPSTVVTVTGTVFPVFPAGAWTVILVVEPQSSSATGFENLAAATLPKWTPVTQPRFSPVIVTVFPPLDGPRAGAIASIFGSPGG